MNNKGTKIFILLSLILFAFFFALSISGGDPTTFMKAVGFQMIIAGISYLVYISPDYTNSAIPIINKKTLAFTVGIGIAVGVAYIFIHKIIPGFSIGVPLVPQSVSTTTKFIVINILSPIFETIFFFGALLVIMNKFKFGKKHPIGTLAIIATFASLVHIGAYITGVFDLPVGYAVDSFTANIGAFISAFIFFFVSGFFVVWEKTRNLLVGMIIHFFPNIASYLKFAVVFALNLTVLKGGG